MSSPSPSPTPPPNAPPGSPGDTPTLPLVIDASPVRPANPNTPAVPDGVVQGQHSTPAPVQAPSVLPSSLPAPPAAPITPSQPPPPNQWPTTWPTLPNQLNDEDNPWVRGPFEPWGSLGSREGGWRPVAEPWIARDPSPAPPDLADSSSEYVPSEASTPSPRPSTPMTRRPSNGTNTLLPSSSFHPVPYVLVPPIPYTIVPTRVHARSPSPSERDPGPSRRRARLSSRLSGVEITQRLRLQIRAEREEQQRLELERETLERALREHENDVRLEAERSGVSLDEAALRIEMRRRSAAAAERRRKGEH